VEAAWHLPATYLPLRPAMQHLRAHFEAPLHVTYPAFGTSPRAGLGDWLIQSHIVNRLGRTVGDQTAIPTCGPASKAQKADVFACLSAHGYRQVDIYQPASRFWAFQGIESAIFVGLAVLLLLLTFYWVTRRTTS